MMIIALARRTVARRSAAVASLRTFSTQPQQLQPPEANRQIPTKVQAWMDDMEDYDSRIHYYSYQQPQNNSKPTMNSVVEGINRHELDHQSRQILKQHLEDAFLRRHAWE